MNKKESNRVKKQPAEQKVEDIYGVHFKYQDLFSRLLKVQKQRQMSEDKQKLPRMSSFDSTNIRQASVHKPKKTVQVGKKTGSVKEFKNCVRSISVKKIGLKVPVTERKNEIFKSFSPSQKRHKKKSVQLKPSVKKIEKKGVVTARIIKKHVGKASLG